MLLHSACQGLRPGSRCHGVAKGQHAVCPRRAMTHQERLPLSTPRLSLSRSLQLCHMPPPCACHSLHQSLAQSGRPCLKSSYTAGCCQATEQPGHSRNLHKRRHFSPALLRNRPLFALPGCDGPSIKRHAFTHSTRVPEIPSGAAGRLMRASVCSRPFSCREPPHLLARPPQAA